MMILAELGKEAGFPDGVINIIHGMHRAVNFILDEPSIKAISFVGGNAVGEYIYTRGSANGNGVAIFTNSGSKAAWFQKNIEASQVGVNVPIPVPLPMFSFTSNKKSVAGGGLSTFYGKPGINFYTQTKTVTSLWRTEEDLDIQGKSMNMPTQS